MADANLVDSIRRKYQDLTPLLNERLRRLWAAAEAREIGWGGMTAVALATGLSQTTISVGLRELQQPSLTPDHDSPPIGSAGPEAVASPSPRTTRHSWPTWRPWSIP